MESYTSKILIYIAYLLFPFFLDAETFITGGLVVHYPFDGNASDIRSNHHGTNYGAIPTTDRHGLPNKALSFNGFTSYVEAPYHFDFTPAHKYFTCTLWVKHKSSTFNESILSFGSSGSSNSGYFIHKDNNRKWKFGLHNQTEFELIYNDSDSHHEEWAALAFTHGPGEFVAYRNGSQVGSLVVHSYKVPNSGQPLRIGCEQDNYFKGSLDEIRIYRRKLQADEIQALYAFENTPPNSPPTDLNFTSSISLADELDSGITIGQFSATGVDDQAILSYSLINNQPTRSSDLIGWFKFDEGNGTISKNFGTQGSDATLENNATFSTSEKKFGSASLRIPSTDQNAHIKLNTPILLGPDIESNPYSISAWIKKLYPIHTTEHCSADPETIAK